MQGGDKQQPGGDSRIIEGDKQQHGGDSRIIVPILHKQLQSVSYRRDLTGLDIPYPIHFGSIIGAGVLHVRSPAEESWTDGQVVSANWGDGTYRVDKREGYAELRDVTTLFRLEILIDFQRKVVKMKFSQHKFNTDPQDWGWYWETIVDWTVVAQW